MLVVKSETTLDGRRLRASALLRNRTREQVRGAKGSLRWSVRGRHLQKVGSFKVPPLPARRRKRVNFLVGIPTNTPPGRYRVKVCVRVRHAFSCGRAGTIPVEEAESGPAQGVPSATPPASEQSASSGSSETSNPSGEEPESSEESVSTAPAHTSPAISVVGGTAHSMGETILREAKKWEGTPYCFAGGEPSGPSHGAGNVEGATQCPGTTKGFDCTGLTLYAVYRATGKVLTHDSTQAANAVAQGGEHIYSKAELEPGDLVYFGGTFSGIEHVGVYAGGGMMWDANIAFWIYPDGVHERSLASVETTEPFVGAVRFTGGTTTGGGGYDIAFQANTGDLWEVGSGPGAIGTGNWKLGMKAGTSPAIATTPGGGYDIAFQANTGDLWEVGSGPGAIGTGNWKLGMKAGTSPAIATTPGGGYDIAFEANTGELWEVGSGPGAIGTGRWRLGMRSGTSPAIATTPGGGYDIAFQANTGDLWEVGSGPGAIGTGNWKLGMKAGTSPAIATTPGGGYDIAFQANTGDLWEVGSGPGAIGTGNWKLGMR